VKGGGFCTYIISFASGEAAVSSVYRCASQGWRCEARRDVGWNRIAGALLGLGATPSRAAAAAAAAESEAKVRPSEGSSRVTGGELPEDPSPGSGFMAADLNTTVSVISTSVGVAAGSLVALSVVVSVGAALASCPSDSQADPAPDESLEGGLRMLAEMRLGGNLEGQRFAVPGMDSALQWRNVGGVRGGLRGRPRSAHQWEWRRAARLARAWGRRGRRPAVQCSW